MYFDAKAMDANGDGMISKDELKKYGEGLEKKPRWLVFNKIDALHDADARVKKALNALRWKRPWFKVSALSGEGCDAVVKAAAKELAKK